MNFTFFESHYFSEIFYIWGLVKGLEKTKNAYQNLFFSTPTAGSLENNVFSVFSKKGVNLMHFREFFFSDYLYGPWLQKS